MTHAFQFNLQLISNGQANPEFTAYCEFDLVDELIDMDPGILDLLPEECKQIDAAHSDLRLAMKEESIKFKEFLGILAEKENWAEQESDDERTLLDLDGELRYRVYSNTDTENFLLGNCTNTADTSIDYVNCLTNYRQDLINGFNEPPATESTE